MYSVVIPCYNEEKNLDRLISRLDNVYRTLKNTGKDLELILVDNGSTDGSHVRITSIVQERDYVKEVRVKVNQGYGYGILQGLKACSGDYLFWLHADLQLPPEAIVEMIGILDTSKYPQQMFIKGARLNRPLSDRFFTFGMGIFESLYLGASLRDINAQPTCIPKKFFETWVNPPHDFSLDLYAYYMAVKSGLCITRVKVVQSARAEGRSSWNTGMVSRIKLIRRTLAYSRVLKHELKQNE